MKCHPQDMNYDGLGVWMNEELRQHSGKQALAARLRSHAAGWRLLSNDEALAEIKARVDHYTKMRGLS